MNTHIWPVNAGSEDGLEGCAHLLHLLACREKMFMVLASCGDPAGNTPVIAVAGLLASQHAWKEFDSQCRTWGSQGIDPGVQPRTLESVGIVGIGAVMGTPVSSTQLASKSSTSPADIMDPGLMCFEHCVLEAARRMQPAPMGQTVCFVLDWHDALASSALWHLEDLMNFSPRPLRERFGALGFEHGTAFPPLRVARQLAARCFEMRDRHAFPEDLCGFDFTFLEAGASARVPWGQTDGQPDNASHQPSPPVKQLPALR